jgi:hypothetical protein
VNRSSGDNSDQKEKLSRFMVKMKLTVASSLVFGWSSWADHVSVEYCFACMRPHIVSAAALVPPEDIATSMALSQMD